MDLLSLGKLGFGPPQSQPQPQPRVTSTAKPRILYQCCPLCDSADTTFLRTADCSRHALYRPVVAAIMTWKRCAHCEHVFTDGYFTSEVTDIIFADTHDNQKPGWEFERQRMISARMVERIAQHAIKGRWLDVGFGNGSLLFTAAEWGFTPVGIDLRPSSVQAIARMGIEANCCDIAALDQPDTFSVITMADVLEHMPFPRIGLHAAHRLLQSKGILFLSMPHFDCPAWRLLDLANANPYWGELEHFHNFSRQRLDSLLRAAGFELLSYAVSERYRICMEVTARRLD